MARDSNSSCGQDRMNKYLDMELIEATINTIEKLVNSIEEDIPEQHRISTVKEILDEIDNLRDRLHIEND